MSRKTLVIGASPNPERYAFKAVNALRAHGHQVVALGIRKGMIGDVPITLVPPEDPDFDTVTLYVGAPHHEQYAGLIFRMRPKRVIFNPGTENPAFETRLARAGIRAERACTLVLLATNQF